MTFNKNIYFNELTWEKQQEIREELRETILNDVEFMEQLKEDIKYTMEQDYEESERTQDAFDYELEKRIEEEIDDCINRTFGGRVEVEIL